MGQIYLLLEPEPKNYLWPSMKMGGTGGGGEGVTPAQVKTILLANTDTALNGASSNPIANKALVEALADYVKSADLSIPTKVSELTNDKKYQTDTDLVTALTPYAKSDDVTAEIIAEIAKVVAGAPESFDTLKEMSDWIAHHEDDATAMNSAISDNKNAITALQAGKADKIEIPTTVAELTDSADYAKTADIPETLPANGGNADTVNNHTVETNVPADAVFTDTIYDDTEVKGSIEEVNSNLDTLEFGEVAGGKNLIPYPYSHKSGNYNGVEITINDDYSISLNGTNTGERSDFGFAGISRISDMPCMVSLKEGKSYTLSLEFFSGSLPDTSEVIINGWNDDSVVKLLANCNSKNNMYTFTVPEDSGIKYGCIYLQNRSGLVFDNVRLRPMLTEGNKVVPYERYIPSIKMLAEENEQQNTEVMDLKMLGWTVPSECPIQNYTDSDDVFHQRVYRIDLGSLSWSNWGNNGALYAVLKKTSSGKYKGFCIEYELKTASDIFNGISDKAFSVGGIFIGSNDLIVIRDTSVTIENAKTSLSGKYVYYELAEEKTINVDGNEAVTKVNESLSVIGKCKNLLNPTLQTTTLNGVTCTANGDGTYTLNGTASSTVDLIVGEAETINGKQYLCNGVPVTLSDSSFSTTCIVIRTTDWKTVGKNGVVFTAESSKTEIAIYVESGVTVSNVVFKPMIATDLNATYDDFVPYTGDGDTLTHDVAELKNELIVLEATSTIEMTASRELDDVTSPLTIPSGYKPIAMYGYNSDNNDNISAIPLLIRSDGKVLFHAKNHSTSDQGIIHFAIRVTFKKVS